MGLSSTSESLKIFSHHSYNSSPIHRHRPDWALIKMIRNIFRSHVCQVSRSVRMTGRAFRGCEKPLPSPIKIVGMGSCGVDYLAQVATYPQVSCQSHAWRTDRQIFTILHTMFKLHILVPPIKHWHCPGDWSMLALFVRPMTCPNACMQPDDKMRSEALEVSYRRSRSCT